MERLSWIIYEVKQLIRNKKFVLNDKISKKVHGYGKDHDVKRYAGKKVLSDVDTNNEIYRRILQGDPFFVGRIGGNEMNTIAYFLRKKFFPFRTDARVDVLNDLAFGAGFFPKDIEYGNKFVEVMCDAVKEVDLIGIWYCYMEEWLLKRCLGKSAMITRLSRLEPWRLYNAKMSGKEINCCWTEALKGKRVLVIHPFTETIEKQYGNNRDRLFAGLGIGEVLPEFDLITLKAVQTMAGETCEFTDWFEALQSMVEKCKGIEFDVAIIGCGAYGFPLAYEIKKMGKIAIHLGGATQLLFGIKGKRWDDEKSLSYQKMVNEYWVRPTDNEKVRNSNQVEGGCYW